MRGLIAVTPKGRKAARLQSVAPFFEAGNVWLPHPKEPGCEWVPELVEELVNFPNAADDDQVDALSQALDRYRTSEVRPFKMRMGVGTQRRQTEI